MQLLRRFGNINLKKGGGEILAFLLTLPIILYMLYVIVDVLHVGSVEERLEYAAYKACRAAVVCDSYDKAKEAAYKTAWEDLLASGEKIDDAAGNGIQVDLIYADGEGIESRAKSGTKKGSKADNTKWEKGNFVQCTVTAKMKTYNIFMSRTRSVTVTMMIEALGEGQTKYPWFEGL